MNYYKVVTWLFLLLVGVIVLLSNSSVHHMLVLSVWSGKLSVL